MKLTIRNRNLPAIRTLDALIQTRLLSLVERVRIDEAQVLVEYCREASPAYRVELHLAVPGPDLRAERIDNTPIQAFTSALNDIELRLRERTHKRFGRAPGRARRTSTPGMRASSFR